MDGGVYGEFGKGAQIHYAGSGGEADSLDTGQYKPKYQVRQHQDMEKEIANKLGHQEDRQAKVKMKSGEYDIRTKDFTDGRK